jgi:hypothetical protein
MKRKCIQRRENFEDAKELLMCRLTGWFMFVWADGGRRECDRKESLDLNTNNLNER